MLNAAIDVLLPPPGLAILAFVLLQCGWRRLGIACLGLLLSLGMPVTAALLLVALDPPPEPEPAEAPQAVVILSGDVVPTRDPADLAPGLLTLERMQAGAVLARRTGLPILVSGGETVTDVPVSLAAMMARSLRQDFHVEARWTEDRSLDTWQNAEFSAAILKQAGIGRIYLVTQAWHMRRALLAFRRFGLQATPAPVRPDELPQWGLAELVPRASGWLSSYYALHEAVGLAGYSLRR